MCLSSVCGSVTDQCYCAQLAAGWEPWQQQEAASLATNNNTDAYIRQFEEAYSATYSGLGTPAPGTKQSPGYDLS